MLFFALVQFAVHLLLPFLLVRSLLAYGIYEAAWLEIGLSSMSCTISR